MSTLSPALSDALGLLGYDLLFHLDHTESLATQNAPWSEQDTESAREVICELVLIIRTLLIEHERQDNGDCQVCATGWPCPVVTTIHSFLKDPNRQFVALANRARE